MSQMWVTVFHISAVKILRKSTFCEFLFSGLSKSRRSYWKNIFAKNWGCFRKKIKSVIISLISAHFERKKKYCKDCDTPSNISHDFHGSYFTFLKIFFVCEIVSVILIWTSSFIFGSFYYLKYSKHSSPASQ